MTVLEHRIDITGNWRNESIPQQDGIQVREPWLKRGQRTVFRQSLRLPPGTYQLELRYDPLTDKQPGPGLALGGNLSRFDGLLVDGRRRRLAFVRDEELGVYVARCTFSSLGDKGETEFSLALRNTRVMRTVLLAARPFHEGSQFLAIPPAHEGNRRGECCLIGGIPFLLRRVTSEFFMANLEWTHRMYDTGELVWWQDGMRLDCADTTVETVHFLGMIHRYDLANGSWYNEKGDHGFSHFVGDRAGTIVVHWTDGETSEIPLIFGYNVWYSRPWDMLWHYTEYRATVGGENFDDVLFAGQEEFGREVVRSSVKLADGIRLMGSNSSNARYVFSLKLGGRKVSSIEVHGVSELHGYPIISAVTLQTEGSDSSFGKEWEEPLASVDSSLKALPCGLSDIDSRILPVDLASIDNRAYEPAVHALQRLLYTFRDELPVLTRPDKPDGYFGPSYDFRGAPEAVYAATYLYYNGPECAAHIADSGTGCASSTAPWAITHYTLGIGVWFIRKSRDRLPAHLRAISRDHRVYAMYDGLEEWFRLYRSKQPGQLPGLGNVWTRGAGQLLREAMAFGYGKFADTYTDWLDAALFAEASPPHWNRIAGDPERAARRIMVGDTLEYGNRENDGHGNCMWGRYLVWHWKGRPIDWNRSHWEATKASVAWIQWQLDNDTIYPGISKDVLYTVSEPATDTYDIYSSYNCLHGIKLAIRMAEQLGEHEVIGRWKLLYDRLRRGILQHLVEASDCGDIWYTSPTCDWADYAHKLVHLLASADGDTYTPLEDAAEEDELERRYVQIDVNSYHYLMRERNYDCLRMYGYGQGFMTQAALLLDEMEDAEKFLCLLVTCGYLPRMGRWLSPEGIVRHRSGDYYVSVKAYMGQDSHVADSTKAVRLMLGVDDNRPDALKLVPRFPRSWTRMEISDFPVLTGDDRQSLGYVYDRTEERRHTFTYRFARAVRGFSVRLGPLPTNRDLLRVVHNGEEVSFECLVSGDSTWVWIRELAGVSGLIELVFGRHRND